MVCAAGFTNARLRSHGYAQTASPAYLASIINRGASAQRISTQARSAASASPDSSPFGMNARAGL